MGYTLDTRSLASTSAVTDVSPHSCGGEAYDLLDPSGTGKPTTLPRDA